ncbi:MAG TPA: hypothetical protein VF498_06185 [Anaerolineales bacterium]
MAVGKTGKIKIASVHAGPPQDMEKLKVLVEERMTGVEPFSAERSPAIYVTGLTHHQHRAFGMVEQIQDRLGR